ncbi:DUF2442 domain-containing protein [Anoxynatronum buryatiense]|uniref:Uncharacterized protein n=1 Tax=Anoxynatronum buryatiense TaxID=489973 RepID=A0AA45WVY8_9CLOT|nr:DUF2442 domain-containing protein [Anoxynatronum buryatiense]SMP55238.1 Protein of unknown function [Anoxynatronum buryatiense]
MEVLSVHTFFQSVTPKHDYTLSIILENGKEIEYSMEQLLNQLRFSSLKDMDVWMQLDVFPTHLEWNKGVYLVTLNIEEIIPDYTRS